MNLLIEKYEYRISLIEPLLGSTPADPEIHKNFIASKAPLQQQGDEGNQVIQNLDMKGVTVFPRDERGLFLYDYHVKGFLKEAGNVLRDAIGVKNLRAKLDRYVFVRPRRIYLLRNGKHITTADGVLERPLRAITMQGERVALASSEMLNPPCELYFTVEILANKEKIEREVIETLLDYGRYKGLGQWRNGSYGIFEWTVK